MTRHRRSRLVALALPLALVGLAGCGGATDSVAGSESSTGPSTAGTALPTAPPTTAAEVPDGVYRTRVTKEALTEAGGYNMDGAGTWTLTLREGTYQLSCAWVDQDGSDCGHSGVSDGDIVLEAGAALGDGSTLWLAYDKALVDELNGMDFNPPTADSPAYRLTWEQDGTDLVFQDLWLPPTSPWQPDDVNSYTLLPWTKIG